MFVFLSNAAHGITRMRNHYLRINSYLKSRGISFRTLVRRNLLFKSSLLSRGRRLSRCHIVLLRKLSLKFPWLYQHDKLCSEIALQDSHYSFDIVYDRDWPALKK